MSQRTPRFGLNFFGGAVEGQLSDDGQKFTGSDRMAMDRILAVLEQNSLHLNDTTAAAATPSRPTAQIGMSGGSLPAGQTYYYRVSWVDKNGLESIAGPEVSVSTPPPLEAPIAPLIYNEDTLTGILGQGLYYYGLTALSDTSAFPDQSALGPVAAATLGPDVTALNIAMPDDLPEGALLFAIWRLGPNEAGFTKIGTAVPGEVFKDQGAVPANPCACDPGQSPPMQTEMVARYSVTVALDVLDRDVAADPARTVTAWRLYRGRAAGSYGGNSLVTEVTGAADEPLPSQWVDEGDPLSIGAPSIVDMRMNLRPFVFDSATDELPAPEAYPNFYPIILDGSLYAKIDGAWTQVGGGGGGGGSSIMTAPDGGRWRLTVANDGTISTMATPEPGPPTPPQAP